MTTQGYTVFSGPPKHGSKASDPAHNLEHPLPGAQISRKNQHANQHHLNGRHVAKLLNAEEDHLPPTIPQELRLAIAQARNAKGWTQEEFAKECQIPRQDINAWEAGKSIPTGQNLVIMEGALGVKLPRPPKEH